MFSFRLGRTVHRIDGVFPPQNPGQNPGQKSGQHLVKPWSKILSEAQEGKLLVLKNSPGHRPIGVLDLKYGSLVDSIDPPLPPRRAIWAAHVHRQCLVWSSGRSIFRSFFRFDFELNFGLVLGPSWARLGLLLTPFWEAKSGQVGPKMRLEPLFVRKCRFSRGPTFSNAFLLFLTPRRVQHRLRTGPRRVQEG